MRTRVGSLLSALACLALMGCSSSTEKKAEEAGPKHAPDVFRVDLDTSKGAVVLEIHRDWAPIGVDQFYSLVKSGFFDDARFFRVVRNFVVQFGINGNPQTNQVWANVGLPDDPVKESNVKGTLTFATAGPNTRSTQLFINLRDNRGLDGKGFAPIGRVVSGMDVVESFYSGYGDMPPSGEGPDPSMAQRMGNAYFESRFPRLDYIKKAVVE